ncbi:MAG TPA: hypothetical protein G4N96_11660, partial [Chloroflexi bacterium]|nr:hypothetical protein [Chloroflexota bacterium]
MVRQVDESGILFNATQIRDAIRQNSYNVIDIETDFPDIFPIGIEDLLSRYLQVTGNKISGTTIIIVYSNRAAGKLIRNPKLISAVESLLIVAHKPAMNSKH